VKNKDNISAAAKDDSVCPEGKEYDISFKPCRLVLFCLLQGLTRLTMCFTIPSPTIVPIINVKIIEIPITLYGLSTIKAIAITTQTIPKLPINVTIGIIMSKYLLCTYFSIINRIKLSKLSILFTILRYTLPPLSLIYQLYIISAIKLVYIFLQFILYLCKIKNRLKKSEVNLKIFAG